MSSELAIIRRSPSDADMNRLTKAAQDAVAEIVKLDGALGAEGVSRLYIERIYAATVAADLSKREESKYRRALVDLTVAVAKHLKALDDEMKKPSSPERGRRIARLAGNLEMANDRVRYFALGIDWRKDVKE